MFTESAYTGMATYQLFPGMVKFSKQCCMLSTSIPAKATPPGVSYGMVSRKFQEDPWPILQNILKIYPW